MGSKAGVILAFLLSVAAAGGSYYLYDSWTTERAIREKVEADKDQLKEKVLSVQAEKEEFKNRSVEYQSKAEAMQGQLEQLQAEQTRMDAEKTNLEKQLQDHQNLIVNLQKKVDDLAKEAEAARQACQVSPLDVKTNVSSPFGPQSFGTVSTTTSALSASASTTPKVVFSSASQEGVTPAPASTPAQVFSPMQGSSLVSQPASTSFAVSPSSADGMPQPGLSTSPAASVPPATLTSPASSPASKVLTVNRKFNFVVVNFGIQDGVKMGDKLKIFKSGKEVATIQIEKLYDKFSAATILQEDSAQQIVEGDEVRKA